MKRILVLLVLCLLIGCVPDYFPRNEVKVRVSEHEVTGVWHLTEKSVAMLHEQNIDSNLPDSTFTLFEANRCVLVNYFCGDEFVSESCTWKIEHDLPQGRGPSKKNEVQIATVTGKSGGICRLNISRDGGPLVLWQYHGDPDARRYVEYIRD
jgi:hypothetical protein